MESRKNKVLCTIVTVYMLAGYVLSQTRNIPVTRFTCQGRPAGYYADIDTGCQVYHMCDGLGRQFSYTCPNTTLFQQRMLICDHWYMVNCSRAESDYDANLLIGQRDKPFVSEQEMHQRTPRPDILTVPYNNNYFDGLKQAETKYTNGNSIVTGSDTTGSDGALDSGKSRFTPPTHSNSHGTSNHIDDHQILVKLPPTAGSNTGDHSTQQSIHNIQYTSSTLRTTVPDDSDDFEIDIRMKSEEQPTTTFEFIKRFDPNSPPTHSTAMTTSQIMDINRHLPVGSDVSSEDVGNSRRKSISSTKFNTFQSGDKIVPVQSTTLRTANTKPISHDKHAASTGSTSGISVPERTLQPPKTQYSNVPSTTMGPPIYYEWKWAVPAFDLEPPAADNKTRNATDSILQASESGRPTYRNATRATAATPRSLDKKSSSTAGPDYNPSSYFVPDYIFPLDNPHPGYQENGAQTSFQVSIPEKGRSYGENSKCPQCHPAYLKPGTCEPCIVQR